MAQQKKTAIVFIGLGALALLALMGSASKASAKSAPALEEDDDDEDVVINPPAPDGTPDEQTEIRVSPEEVLPEATSSPSDFTPQTAEDVPPEIQFASTGNEEAPVFENAVFTAPGSDPLDQKLAKLAAQDKITVPEAVDQLVTEVTQGIEPAPIAIAETQPELDPNGTVALARLLLSRENLPGWKEDMQDEISEWQSGVGGLKPDGLLGMKSLARMAQEVGLLPLVRYWPKQTPLAQALKEYRAAIGATIADLKKELPDSAAQIEGLGYSIDREKGQTYGNDAPPPAGTLDWVQDVEEKIGDNAEAAGEKELRTA